MAVLVHCCLSLQDVLHQPAYLSEDFPQWPFANSFSTKAIKIYLNVARLFCGGKIREEKRKKKKSVDAVSDFQSGSISIATAILDGVLVSSRIS